MRASPHFSFSFPLPFSLSGCLQNCNSVSLSSFIWDSLWNGKRNLILHLEGRGCGSSYLNFPKLELEMVSCQVSDSVPITSLCFRKTKNTNKWDYNNNNTQNTHYLLDVSCGTGIELDTFCHVPHLLSQQHCEASLAQFEDGGISPLSDNGTYHCSLLVQPGNFHLCCTAHFTDHLSKFHFIRFSSLPCQAAVVRGKSATC